MTRRKWVWAALLSLTAAVAGGLAYAKNSQAGGYVCPLTGENLPCEKCCPLNQQETYTCPITGEELPCPECCPLNGAK